MGFNAITSTNGKEGVEKALAEKPDLILMDIIMPEMDGWEATRILRANPETKDVPILATTVFTRPSDLQRCIDAGCNDRDEQISDKHVRRYTSFHQSS